jgi:hypothetical protein
MKNELYYCEISSENNQTFSYGKITAKEEEYKPAEITNSWEEIGEIVSYNDFEDVKVGDYKALNLSDGSEIIMRVAGINCYYVYGSDKYLPHIDFISDIPITKTVAWTTGSSYLAYSSSLVYKYLNGDFYSLFPDKLKEYIIDKYNYLENRISGATTASSSTEQNLGKIWIPSEYEVFGNTIFSSNNYGAGKYVQYPYFEKVANRLNISSIKEDDYEEQSWCLLNYEDGQTASICICDEKGCPNTASATTELAIRFGFRLGGAEVWS